MRPKSLILLMLALGCGLVASIGINQVMANRRSGPSENAETTPIFVALTEIGMGDPLTPEKLKLEDWPKEKVPPGSLGKLEDVQGRRTRSKFYPGEPILEAKLLAKGEKGAGATEDIPEGMRVVSVRVDAVSGSSGMIMPGDRVDVLVHVKASSGKGVQKTTTRTFLQNVKVFAVDDLRERSREDQGAVAAKTISLLVTPEQAEMVMMAAEMGSIRLVMRSPTDTSIAVTRGVDPRTLLMGSGASVPDEPAPTGKKSLIELLESQKPRGQSQAADDPNAFTMQIIEGPKVRQVKFSEKETPQEVSPGEAGSDDEGIYDETTDDAEPQPAEPGGRIGA